MIAYKKESIKTPKGPVFLEGPVDDKYLETLTMNERLTLFRPPKQQKEALKTITGLPHGMVFIARHENEIIGYVTFHHPDEYSRWHKHPRILEMGGIEISPDWRKCGVASNLMRVAFSAKVLEQFIVITLEYCWHWDLRNSGLSIWSYQEVLTNLFRKVGLEKVPTDDPDIMEHPANVLMAKIGEKVSKQDILLFESMKFKRNFGTAVKIS